VFVAVQPGGAAPGVASSKLTISANEFPAAREVERIITVSVFMVVPSLRAFFPSLRTSVLFALRIQCGLDGFGQRLCVTSAPIMQEQDSRILMRHVTVNGHDIHARLP